MLDATAELIEIHRGPGPGGYEETRRATGDATISPQAFPDGILSLTRSSRREGTRDALRRLRHGQCRRDRILPPRRGARARLGVGHRQPDAVLGLLRGAGPRRAQTTRLRLGPGTAICGTRIAPVHASAMATLNRLAPGRVHLGIGTGNTAMRTMGQPPMRIAAYDDYLRVLSGLLRGEVVDYTFNGVTRPIKILMHDKEYMSLEPRIPLYVSGFGPRAMELAGRTGTASSSPSRRAACPWPRRSAARARGRAGRAGGSTASKLRPHQHRAPRAGRARRLRARARRHRPERHGERLLLLRRGARARHRSPALSPAHVEALLRARGGNPAPSTGTSAPTSSTTRACIRARPS